MLQLSIISPEKKILETECLQVTIPTTTGVITVLPHHAALYSVLQPGDVIVKISSTHTDKIVVNSGFVNVNNNKVTLLTDFGIRLDDIDEQMIKKAKEQAEKMMAEKVTNEQFATNQAELFKALLQLNAVRRHKKV